MKHNLDIDELKERFKFDLIGHWISSQGTFDEIMSEEWIFYHDGSGLSISKSSLMGVNIENIKWKRKGLFTIEIYSDDFDWKTINYDFCRVVTDIGHVNALVELNEKGQQRKGFGISDIPLVYFGGPDDIKKNEG